MIRVSSSTALHDHREDLRVVSIDVVLSQIEPGDSTPALSYSVTGVQALARTLAAIGVRAVVAGSGAATLAKSIAYKANPRNYYSRNRTIPPEQEEDPSDSRPVVWNKGKGRGNGRRESRAAIHAKAFGNIIRHFLLEFTLEDGTVYTMEKTPKGIELYPGSTVRKQRQSVWHIKLCTRPSRSGGCQSTTSSQKPVFLRDLVRFCRQANPGYHTFKSNCKHFSWDALTTILGTEAVTFETPTEFRTVESYGEFRDLSQLRELNLQSRNRRVFDLKWRRRQAQ